MNYVKPVVNVYTAYNLKGGLQLAEFAGRLCYKSEGKAAPGTYQKFLLMLIEKGHTSVLEHCPIYICGYEKDLRVIAQCIRKSPFSRYTVRKDTVDTLNPFYYIFSNLRVVYDCNKEFAKQLIMTSTMDGNEVWQEQGATWYVPKPDHPYARMSAYMTTLRSIVDELVRERVQSPCVESTRWCNYSANGKFEGITFCLPHWINNSVFDICMKTFIDACKPYKDIENTNERLYEYSLVANKLFKDTNDITFKRCYHYIKATTIDELLYNEAQDDLELLAQDSREYLFLGIKSEIYYTGYNKDWDNIIQKRLYDKFGKAHENMHIIMKYCEDHLNCIRNSNREEDEREKGS